MSSQEILYLEIQRRLFNEAHNAGFTNADIAKLLNASVGHINNCASCSDTMLNGSKLFDFIAKCRLRGFVKELAEDMGYVVIERPSGLSQLLRDEALAGLESIKMQIDEGIRLIQNSNRSAADE